MKKSPKICFLVANEFVYDNAVYCRAAALAAAGYAVTVIALMDREGLLSRFETKENFAIRRINVITRRLPDFAAVKILRYFEYLAKGLAACLKAKADVYHACDSLEMLFMGVIASSIMRAKLVYDTKDFHSDEKAAAGLPGKLKKRLIYVFEKVLIKKADAVAASSESIARRLKETYGIRPPVAVRECKPFAMVEGSDRIREVLNIPADRKIIIYFGNIVKERNLDVLARAVAHLDAAALVLIGDGGYKTRLAALVSELNLSERVKFLGRVGQEDLAAYISSADIGITIFPNDCFNHTHNIDNRLFYYIACGVPVASSNNPERRNLIEEYGLGLVFDPENPEDIAEKINNLLRDRALYDKIKKRVIGSAKNTLNLENESKKLLDMYKNLCAQP